MTAPPRPPMSAEPPRAPGATPPAIAYYCMACPEVFYDADTSNAHHDATGHHQTWKPDGRFGAPASASRGETPPDGEPSEGETFMQYVTRTKGAEEATRLRIIMGEHQRRFPRDLAIVGVLRAFAAILGDSPSCPVCNSRQFDAAPHITEAQDEVLLCPVCEPEGTLAYLHTRYPETNL
jgi:hypothetical protein